MLASQIFHNTASDTCKVDAFVHETVGIPGPRTAKQFPYPDHQKAPAIGSNNDGNNDGTAGNSPVAASSPHPVSPQKPVGAIQPHRCDRPPATPSLA